MDDLRGTAGESRTTATGAASNQPAAEDGVGVSDAALPVPTLDDVLTADPDQFIATYQDIAAINLACATGLPKAEDIDIPKYLALLDAMAAAVRLQTERSWRLFDLKPHEFKHSKNVFRALTLERVLRVQFKVHYNPLRTNYPTDRRGRLHPEKPWTDDSGDAFIHGILGERRTGTCSSLPVASIAVGRRIGYPLKLVRVPEHCLYRWDDGNDIFNIQNTTRGAEILPDEHYREWPVRWDEDDYRINARTKVWLHSLTPRQEVSKFLCNRAITLRHARRFKEAFDAIEAAQRFDPGNPACAEIWLHIEQKMTSSANPPAGLGPMQHISVVGPGALGSPIEPGRELLDQLDPFRDRTKDPKHLHVRITTISGDRRKLAVAPPNPSGLQGRS